MADGDKYYLVIPNYEIRKLFIRQIREWFRYQAGSDRKTLDKFCNAFPDGDGELIEELLMIICGIPSAFGYHCS